jgi:hypothetical protein
MTARSLIVMTPRQVATAVAGMAAWLAVLSAVVAVPAALLELLAGRVGAVAGAAIGALLLVGGCWLVFRRGHFIETGEQQSLVITGETQIAEALVQGGTRQLTPSEAAALLEQRAKRMCRTGVVCQVLALLALIAGVLVGVLADSLALAVLLGSVSAAVAVLIGFLVVAAQMRRLPRSLTSRG